MIVRTDISQNSLEWMAARAGVVTASEFESLLTPKWEPRKGLGVETYLCQKLAERWIGPLPSFNTLDMEWGQLLEEQARPWLAFHLDKEIKEVAFITTAAGKIGWSPDGLIDETGVEIKCPNPAHHVKYLMAGKVPDDYLAQVHGSMYVTGFKSWRFVSFHRRFPKLVLNVERDEKIQAVIGETLAAFVAKLDAAFNRLCEMNGGPPKRFTPHPTPTPADENGGVTP